MFKQLHEDTILIYQIGGASNVDQHINHWQAIIDNPSSIRKEQEELKARLRAELEKMVTERIKEHRAKFGKKPTTTAEEEEEPIQHDEEAQQFLDPAQSGWKKKRLQVTNLNKKDVVSFISQQKVLQEDIRNLMKLPVETKTQRTSSLLSTEKEEQYDKPLLDLVNDLILWGISNNEPLGN